MAYSANGALAEMVCDEIGWRYETRPIEVFKRRSVVYVQGTILKPEEWRSLLSKDGMTLSNGSTIKIVRAPNNL